MPPPLTIEPDFDQGLVRVTRDRAVLRSYVIKAEIEGVEVEIDVFTRDDGEAVCRSIRTSDPDGPRGLTSSILRKVPIATMISRSRRSSLVVMSPNAVADLSAPGPADPYGLRDRTPVKGKSLDDRHLEAVVRVYRDAAAAGHRPTLQVARVAGVGRSTAARWIRIARDRGILGPARRGAGGEAWSARSD